MTLYLKSILCSVNNHYKSKVDLQQFEKQNFLHSVDVVGYGIGRPALGRQLDAFDTHVVSPKNPSHPVYSTRYHRILSGRLPAVLQFQVSLKQEGSASLAAWHVHIPDKIIIELSVRRSDQEETGGDLEGAHVPPG